MKPSCLITGATGGVAQAITRQLAAEGWRLALASRRAEELAESETQRSIQVDVSTESGASEALQAAEQMFGAPPDAVVNCAGAILVAPIARTTEAQYRACMAANLDSAFFIAKAYSGQLSKSKRPGSLLLFSSVAAAMGVSNHPVIAMAKGAIESLVRSLAADFSGIGLRVNAIAPGLMETPATQRMLSSDAAREQIAAQYPLGRFGRADDAAELAAFLISDRAGWISGQIIALDGGFSAVRPYVRKA